MRLILVATDGSATADRAVDAAANLAKALSAKLLIITIGDDPAAIRDIDAARAGEGIGDILEARARRIVGAAADRVSGMIAEVAVDVGWGDIAETILAIAKREKADMIVIGRRGLGRLTRLLMGSVSQKIVSLATCPVTVVP
jgi:nucleotide-binding universal stress UspA family protein